MIIQNIDTSRQTKVNIHDYTEYNTLRQTKVNIHDYTEYRYITSN